MSRSYLLPVEHAEFTEKKKKIDVSIMSYVKLSFIDLFLCELQTKNF